MMLATWRAIPTTAVRQLWRMLPDMKTARWYGILYLHSCFGCCSSAVDGVEQNFPLRQTRHTSFYRFSQFGALLAVFRTPPLAVAGRCAAEFLGSELGGTDRLSADALRGCYHIRSPGFIFPPSPSVRDATRIRNWRNRDLKRAVKGDDEVKPFLRDSMEGWEFANLAAAAAALSGKLMEEIAKAG